MAKEVKSDSMMQTVGVWSFIVGIIIALIAGFFPLGAFMTSVLIILGLIVGFLNVTGHETQRFLMAAVSMVIVLYFGGQTLGTVELIGGVLAGIMNAFVTFIVPATVIVAIKAIYDLAHD